MAQSTTKKGTLPPITLECPTCGHRWESRAAGGQKIRCPAIQCSHRVKVPVARLPEQGAGDDAHDGQSSRAEPVMPPLRRSVPDTPWGEEIIEGELVELDAAVDMQHPPDSPPPSPLPVEDPDSNATTHRGREAMDRLRFSARQQQPKLRDGAHRQAASKMPAVHYADRLDDPSIAAEALNQVVWLIQGLADALRLDLVPGELQYQATEARQTLGGVERALAQAHASGAQPFRAAIAVGVPVITRAQKLLDEMRHFQPQQQLTAGPPSPESHGQVTEEMMRTPGDSAGFAVWLGDLSARIVARTDALSDDDPEPWYRPAVVVDKVAQQESIRRQQEQQRAADAQQQTTPAPPKSYAQQHPVLSEMTRITTRMMQRSR